MLFRGFKPSLWLQQPAMNMEVWSWKAAWDLALGFWIQPHKHLFMNRSFLWWRIEQDWFSKMRLAPVPAQLEHSLKTRIWASFQLTKISSFHHAVFHLEIISLQTMLLRRSNISEVIKTCSVFRKSFETQGEFHSTKIYLWTIQRQWSELSITWLQWSLTCS